MIDGVGWLDKSQAPDSRSDTYPTCLGSMVLQGRERKSAKSEDGQSSCEANIEIK